MKKVCLFFLVLNSIFLFSFSVAKAQDSVVNIKSSRAVNAGNKICPVSGEKIDEKFKATYEYQGKIYNFCCAGCIPVFKKDPDKYIRKVNAELNRESKVSKK